MRILIVDDTQLNITLLQYVIKKIPDYESVSFTDPQAALAWCRDHEPDLVVVDYAMSDMDGIQFTQQFRGFESYKDIPVLMVTGNDETTVRHKALIAGVTDFLNKPLDNSEFVARARNMLALRQCNKKLQDHASWLSDEVRKATIQITSRERETIFCLSNAAEFSRPESSAHVQRVARYAHHIAFVLNLPLDQQALLLEAAPMHDVGNISIPEAILKKPSALSSEEFVIVKNHTVIGHALLNVSKSPLLMTAAEIALTHHEKFDGSGYPRGLAGNDIPLFGRIVAVADVFDVLTSTRPYKTAWSVSRAAEFIRKHAETHFDPTCVEAFFSDFEEVLLIKHAFTDPDSAFLALTAD